MTHLSLPVERMRAHYDAVVVGSGYGGGVAASRLARCGRTVALLERGREFVPGEFPNTAAEAAREFQVTASDLHTGAETGLYDFHLHEGVSVFVGCGLGGTSLLNASVALRAEPRVFEDPRWPGPLRDAAGMAPYYQRAEAMLEPAPYPEAAPRLPKLEALAESARRLGASFYRPPINVTFEDRVNHAGVTQGACRLCGDCVSGCNYGAKNTTAMNYLPDAVAHGAEIFTCVLVTRLERGDGRWIIHYRLPDTGRGAFQAPELFITADVVVLSAGTLGTAEILLRSQAQGLCLSSRLGHRFTGNGDVLAFGYDSAIEIGGIGFGARHPDGRTPVGPCITGIIDVREQPDLRDGMVIEEGSIPGALSLLLPEALAAIGRGGFETARDPRSLLRQRERELESLLLGPYHGAIANTQTYLVMTHDDDAGRIELSGNDRAVVIWDRAGDERIFHRVDHHLREATTAIEGIHVRDPLWSKVAGNSLVTVHPLGGVVMGEDATTGVVNHRHQVFAGKTGTQVHEGLYVADGSVVPVPLGVNPLLTITALAERAMTLVAEEHGWTLDCDAPAPALPPAPPTVPGIEFTERMSGWFSPDGGDDFEAAARRGHELGSSLSFILTIASEDLDRMLTDPEHTAQMAGTVVAPTLSAQPLA
ncbi:MAG: GMC family oxidoreductase, partial [Candidatus Dormibacteraeota bacterium]|nr:GMC family oxidoreductase [Candidatus Dormibacteraeota bacterium]